MIIRMSDALRDSLLAALLDVLASIELSDDDQVEPRFASDVLEDVTYHLDALAESDRALLVTLIRKHAVTESDPDRRQIIEDAPEDLGLLDED